MVAKCKSELYRQRQKKVFILGLISACLKHVVKLDGLALGVLYSFRFDFFTSVTAVADWSEEKASSFPKNKYIQQQSSHQQKVAVIVLLPFKDQKSPRTLYVDNLEIWGER